MTRLNPTSLRLCCTHHRDRDATRLYGPAVPPVTVLPDGTRFTHPRDAAKARESWLPLCDLCSSGTDPEIRQHPAGSPGDPACTGWTPIGEACGQTILLSPRARPRIHPARATPPPRDVLELARLAKGIS